MIAQTSLGVYVSVPFCRAKCSFCNFASVAGAEGAIGSYVQKLCAEIDSATETAVRLGAELPTVVDTIYFGGGTPSLLEPKQLQQIFAALRRRFDVTVDAEITLEAAPGQIAQTVLEEALELGVNRVSLGVQSFIDRECAAVGRLHTASECVREIQRLHAAGLNDVGADLIAGLPLQTANTWRRSLDIAAGLAREGALTHLSVYMLEVDEDSRLGNEVINSGLRFHAPRVPKEDVVAELYEMACDTLPEGGFGQYEISNFAVRTRRSRHNCKYWLREPYMGFGLDAHSMLHCEGGGVRFANADELGSYMSEEKSADPALNDLMWLGKQEDFEETVFLGLRMNEGLSVEGLRCEFGREIVSPLEDAARELMKQGFVIEEDGYLRLTRAGRLVSNDVFGELLMNAVV